MKSALLKKWQIANIDNEISDSLARDLHVHPIVARLLYNRHIRTVSEGQLFLSSEMESLQDPFTLKDMRKAVEHIAHCIEKDEKIVIYGDYDVDGITATAVLFRLLKRLGANADYYIPERQSEGYGLNAEALEHLLADGAALVVTVDCGISSYDIVEVFKNRVCLIITDHHTVPPQTPDAYAVINPKQTDCAYADKNLSGVGVAFKLCQALWEFLYAESYEEDLDIVAMGTVADVVPLVGENRILVKKGLEKINKNPQLGIAALIEVSGLSDKVITAGHIGFSLAPRLNAAGRVTQATQGVKLLTASDREAARELAEELQAVNLERRQIEQTIMEEARQNVLLQGALADKVLVVAGVKWHAGVIGIVASRLVEEFYKPTLMITVDEGIGKGSCRSIEAFDMYEALRSVSDILIQFGGHKQAAGFSILAENIPELRRRLTEYCELNLTSDEYIPIVKIDTELLGESISIQTIQDISLLEPYGMGNSTPIFCNTTATVENVFLMGYNKQHVKFQLRCGNTYVDAISWFGKAYHRQFFPGDVVKVAFTLQKNEWQGKITPQLMLQDIQHIPGETARLTREGMREIYSKVKRMFRHAEMPQYAVEMELIKDCPPGQTPLEAMLSLDVLEELGLLRVEHREEGGDIYQWCPATGTLDLVTSVTFLKYST